MLRPPRPGRARLVRRTTGWASHAATTRAWPPAPRSKTWKCKPARATFNPEPQTLKPKSSKKNDPKPTLNSPENLNPLVAPCAAAPPACPGVDGERWRHALAVLPGGQRFPGVGGQWVPEEGAEEGGEGMRPMGPEGVRGTGMRQMGPGGRGGGVIGPSGETSGLQGRGRCQCTRLAGSAEMFALASLLLVEPSVAFAASHVWMCGCKSGLFQHVLWRKAHLMPHMRHPQMSLHARLL
eukprot:365768-Chlamydomonas_euryale.AAC.2